jgi:tetratricopeptide (TPR) repeat protein
MKFGWAAAVALPMALVILPHYLDSCAYAPPELRFATYHNPLPDDIAAGRTGVVRPHFRRRYLLLAYREMMGPPLNAGERENEPNNQYGPSSERAKPWLDARKSVPGAGTLTAIDGDKKVPGQDYETYSNCLADAFTSAAATLQQRVARWGAQSPQTAEWLRGQDQVFQNCSGGPVSPQPLPAGDRMLSADRDYQIAAAEFYAGQYDRARADFDKIAATASSQWHDAARYVAARACIRQATLGNDKGKLGEAATRLEVIVKDPSAGPWRARAEGLLGFVRAQVSPQQQLTALGEQLMHPGSREHLERVLTDYTVIWDHLPKADDFPHDSDVARWIGVFQLGDPAFDIWREKKTLPWLVAALRASAPSPAAARQLIAAAHEVKPESPAWDSAVYYGILMQIRAGELDAARTWSDRAIATKPSASTLNLLRSERFRLVRDWTEFLRFAPRRPVTDMSEDDDFDSPIDEDAFKKKPVALDEDSVWRLNRGVPLSLWMDAAQNSLLPADLQAGIAQSGWIRAVVLGDNAAARTLATRLQQLRPAMAAEMRTWLAEKDPAASRFTATFLMLRAPGLEPMVRPGMGRVTPVMKSDIMRDNWWMLSEAPHAGDVPIDYHEALADFYPDGNFGPTDFLPAGQRSAGEKEWQQLAQRAGDAVIYLCANTIEWAKAHPQDPRVPQALHLAVEATHYGPSDKASSYSRQAFDLLHQRYANSEWTKKTKYWY